MRDTLTVPGFARLADYCGVWAIEPVAAHGLWALAGSLDLGAHVASGAPALQSDAMLMPSPAGDGKSIAVVRLAGTLMKGQTSFGGGTSTVQARRDIRKAAADAEVSAILLMVDSPGGTVAGTADLAAEVQAAADVKPVWAQIEDLGASAAYWIASQADKVFANTDTALVGSIGTLMTLYDLSGAAEKAGAKTLVFATGPLKGAGAPGAPVTDAQKAYFQGLVESSQQSFDAAVQAGRSLTKDQLAAVRTGGVFPAADAVTNKLIDGVQSLDRTISMLAIEGRRRGQSPRKAASAAVVPSPLRSVTTMTFEAFVRAQGFDPAALSEAQTAFMRGLYAGQHSPAPAPVPQPPVVSPVVTAPANPPPNPFAVQREAEAVELRRVAGIKDVCKSHPAIAAEAIEKGWSVEKAENAAIRASLPNHVGAINPHAGPTILVKGGRTLAQGVTVNDAIAAALCLALGTPKVETRFKADELEAADDHFRSIGLQQLLLMSAAQNGYHARPGDRVTSGNLREVMQYAFAPPQLSAGPSTVSLPGILGNVANKELIAGYTEEDETWREIAIPKNVPDFKQVTSYRMLDNMEYEELGPGGKIKSGTVDQESYTRQAKTFAKLFALTRTDFVNDDLGAFQDLRTRIGRGSKKKFNNVFWTRFMASIATLFTTGRKNYVSGADSTLLTDGVGLEKAILAFRQLKSPTGDGKKRVGGRPDRVLVPPELEFNATRLWTPVDPTQTSQVNIHANKYRPVVVPWLSDPEFPGYSATGWGLFRDPMDLPAMVVSFLNGVQTPIVESAAADFDTLGVQFRGYHDFGADPAEYLAGVWSKGAA